MRFTWDKRKEQSNLAKHGVDFSTAQQAFGDPSGFALADDTHSAEESRFYWFGMVGGRVLTVRFVIRTGVRIIGAAYMRKGKELYEKKNA